MTGTVVQGVHGDVVHTVTYSRMQPSLRLAAWVQLLAVTAAQPERPFSAVTIGRAEKHSSAPGDASPRSAHSATTRPHGSVWRRGHLGASSTLFGVGMTEPLPLYCKTSAAYAAARVAGSDDADDVAKKAWESGFDLDE